MIARPRFLAAVLAASAVGLAVGFLLYGVLFASLFEEGALRLPGVMKEPVLPWILLGQLGFALLLTLVVSWRGDLTFRGGAQTGAILGFLMAVGYDFSQYGTTHLWTLQATLVDPFVTAVLVGLPGGVAGSILGRGRDAAAAPRSAPSPAERPAGPRSTGEPRE